MDLGCFMGKLGTVHPPKNNMEHNHGGLEDHFPVICRFHVNHPGRIPSGLKLFVALPSCHPDSMPR